MRNVFVIPLLMIAFLVTNNSKVVAQTKPDPVKMLQARVSYNEGDYANAIQIYESLKAKSGEDALLNFRMAESYLGLKDAENALKCLDKARAVNASVDVELEFCAALANRMLMNQPKAIEHVNLYLAQKKLPKPDVEKGNGLKAMCEATMEYMANPVDVKIESASPNINTVENHEYHPSITAEGRIMVFTSRRPDSEGGKRYEEDDDFFEDVYISYWDDNIDDWAPATPIPGRINTAKHDASLSISPDGRQLFLYGNQNGGDIFVSKTRMNKNAMRAISRGSADAARLMSINRWSKAYSLGKNVNSSYWDSNASLTGDGNSIYFSSERPKGKGNGDIWMSTKISSRQWSPAVHQKAINTVEDEKGAFIHPDGNIIFFSSKGHSNMGGYDIFRSVKKEDGSWSAPENIGYPINTTGDEVDFVVTRDGKTAYYCTTNADGGKYDIKKIDLSNYDILTPEKLRGN
ncbi:hypothetical protein ACFLR1_03350 [Bacteroidota bacterium]